MAITLSTKYRQDSMDFGDNSMFDTTGVLEFHDGTRPPAADNTASGTNTLASIALPNNAFLDPSTAGTMTKAGVWTTSSAALSGTATWFRFKLAADSGTTGTSDRRLDGNCGTSGSDMNISTTSIIAGSAITVNTCSITKPAS